MLLPTEAPLAEQFQSTGTIDVFFSPKGGATRAVVNEIDSATKTIRVQAFSFTNKRIAKALVNAKKRGLDVEVVFDAEQQKNSYTSARFISRSGISTLIDSRHNSAHNKIIIIDGRVLITGSFNFTEAGEWQNAENLLVIKGNEPLVERYEKNYALHRGHSATYKEK